MRLALLRLFVETRDRDTAAKTAQKIASLLETIGYSVSDTKVRPYWKIPDYIEIVLEMMAPPACETAFDSALDGLGTGWLRRRREEAIWNHENSNQFADDLVRWAHLEEHDE